MINNIISNIVKFLKKMAFERSPNAPLTRAVVSKTKWMNNADSPVMLMIDDFTNAWVGNKDKNSVKTRCDWGGLHDRPNSIFNFIDKNLFTKFPKIKATFFTVVGPISQYTFNQPFGFAGLLNHDQESISFFRNIDNDSRFEIAYHGFNHGTSGKKTEDFIQEWRGFKSLSEAIAQIQKGLSIYREVTGKFPSGGKYGGWDYNGFADESIDACKFRWWCRDWMPKDTTNSINSAYYEPQVFGRNGVIALPSTVHGNHWSKKQIKLLIENRQIISIEEHIGAIRPDGLVQTPNVYDDMPRLLSLFNYLRGKKLWYATGTEIADYYDAYLYSKITDITVNKFRVEYRGKKPGNILTLIIQPVSEDYITNESGLCLICPNGQIIRSKHHDQNNTYLINISVQTGEYQIKVGK